MAANFKNRLSDQMSKLLSQQVQCEGDASAQYLEMANWAEKHGYVQSAKFLYKQSDEERSHMLKIIKYINDMGGVLHEHHSHSQVKRDFESLQALFYAALAFEVNTSQAISKIVEHAFAEKDFMTFGFLQWFILEQIEEETVTRRHLELCEMINQQQGVASHMLDQAIGQEA